MANKLPLVYRHARVYAAITTSQDTQQGTQAVESSVRTAMVVYRLVSVVKSAIY